MKRVFQRILIAVDRSECSAYAVRVGSSLAAELSAEALLVHVVNRPAAPLGQNGDSHARLLAGLRRQGRALLRKMCAVARVSVACGEVLREGTPADEVLNAAEEWGAQLIVLGSYSQTRLAHILLGSTAETVARRARCPVLTVAADTLAYDRAGCN